MANYGMELNKMQSSYNAALCRAGIVTGLAQNEVVPNGGLVFADNATALPTSIYGTVDLNLENFTRFDNGGTNGAAYIIDSADVNQFEDSLGNVYKIGDNLTGLTFPQNKPLRMRKLEIEDRLYLFDGNVTGNAPTVGQYLIPTNDSFFFSASAGPINGGVALMVQSILPLTAGLSNLGNKYLCKVVSL